MRGPAYRVCVVALPLRRAWALASVDAEQLKEVLVRWPAAEQPRPSVVHLDGKVLKSAAPAPARAKGAATPSTEIAPAQQKPLADKALTLVNLVTGQQQLCDQIAVPRDTNEEAAASGRSRSVPPTPVPPNWCASTDTSL